VNRDIEAGIVEHDFHKHTDLATGSVIISFWLFNLNNFIIF
jgi:hypothetical protein